MMKEKPQEKTLVERNDIRVEYNLMNNLGFNLCVAPWSPVMRLVAVTSQVNFPQKITFNMLYTNIFLIRICSRTLFIILRM